MVRLRWLAGLVVFAAVAVTIGLAWTSRVSRPTRVPLPPEPRLVTLGSSADRPDPAPGLPNMVLVIGCTVRKDQTSIHGPPGTTPFLAQLARDGGRFDDLVTAAPWTRAASTALLTGFHPISVGMAEPLASRDERVLDPRVTTLAEHLRAHGYATAGLTTNPNLNRVYGFDQGFDVYRQLARLWRDDGTRLPGDLAVREAVALLDTLPPDRPVYLQIVLIDAHAPFTASPHEAEVLADPQVPEEVIRYRASLRRMDRAVGQLDAALRERGLDPANTVFAFANDHGEGLRWPAHHGAGHGRQLLPSAVGGVFVARGPGIVPGVRVGGVASQIDVPSTLVGLAGLPPFPGSGLDASGAFRGGEPAIARDRAFSETWFKEVDRAAIYTADSACQRDLGGAPTAPFVDGCFDRRADPDHASPGTDPALEAALVDWRAARVAEEAAFGPVGHADLDAETSAQLEALGYATDAR